MKKKQILYLVSAFIVAVMSLCLTSCNKDENGGSQSVLVGTWRHDFSNSDYCTYTFNSNGSGVFSRPSWDVTESFTYKIMDYDSKSGRGEVLEIEGGQSRTINFTLMGSTLVYEGGMVYTKVR